ncbi:MAG: hypothetical protein R2697_16530 [Ilumatobacteraceae bacterium]
MYRNDRDWRPVLDRQGSDDLDGNCVGVGGERFDVGSVAGQDHAAWLGNCDNERVDGRTCSGASSQLGGSPSSSLADGRFDDAHLQESVGVGIAPRVTVERLDQDHRRNDRWPQFVGPERPDERQCRLGAGRQTRDAAAVEDQHGSPDSVERPIPDAPSDGIGRCPLTLARLSDLSGEFFEVLVCLSECILAFQLCAQRNLQEFRGGEVALLQLFVEIVGQVHLNTRHAPNHTPNRKRTSTGGTGTSDRSGTARTSERSRCEGAR